MKSEDIKLTQEQAEVSYWSAEDLCYLAFFLMAWTFIITSAIWLYGL